jgi:hypothetical protein
LRNTTTGEQEYWQMRGTEITAEIALPTVDSGWLIAATGHFDSNGTTDIVWHDTDNGVVYLSLTGNDAAAGEFDLELEAGWVIEGAGDFDGDGRGEIVISNQGSQLEIWGLRGKFVHLGQLSMRQGWRFAGIGDVDGDGNDDIISQNRRDQKTEVALMSSNFSATRVLLDKQKSARRSMIDAADYDGDGHSDLLWRSVLKGRPGGVGVWYLSNDSHLSGSLLNLNLGTNLSVVGSADYNADDFADLLVFDPASRRLTLWLMDRTGPVSVQSLGVLARDWLPAGFNANDDVAIR